MTQSSSGSSVRQLTLPDGLMDSQAMSTLVVQERHLWINLADIRDTDKYRFLYAPLSQVGLFGEAVESFYPAVLGRPEADGGHPTSCPGGPLLAPPVQRPQPLRLLVTEVDLLRHPPPPRNLSSSNHLGLSVEQAAGSRPRPSRPLPNQEASEGADDPKTGPSFIASEQQWLSPGRTDASAHSLCPSTEAGTSCNTHSDPTPVRHAVRVGSLNSTMLPGYDCGAIGPACTVSGSLASASQPVLLANPYYQTRLCDSFRPASPSLQGHLVHPCSGGQWPCAQGRERSPLSLYPRKEVGYDQSWTSCPEPVPSQAAVQDAYAETHFQVHPSPRFVCSDQPEGRILSCLDSPSTQTVSLLCIRGMAYQYKVLLFVLAPSPRVFTKVTEAAIAPMCERGVHILNYLDDWLILTQSREQLCEHRDMVLSHLSHPGLRVNWEKSKL
ncbi:hypothetical protein PO909_016614 [Leuciscus waleckii]